MAIKVRGRSDESIKLIVRALEDYQAKHPEAQIELYRQNSVSIRVRIIDPRFAKRDKAQRSKYVWQYLDRAPEDAVNDISFLLLITPEETEKSFANFEFEDPIPSKL